MKHGKLTHYLVELGDVEPIIATAAASTGDMVALMGRNGTIYLCRLKPNRGGGVGTIAGEDPSAALVKLEDKLGRMDDASPSAMRFRLEDGNLDIFAVDIRGNVLHKRILTGLSAT